MATYTTEEQARGTPVPYRKFGALAVSVSHVLLFLMLFSPVWLTGLGAWGAWEFGTKVVHPALQKLWTPEALPPEMRSVRGAWNATPELPAATQPRTPTQEF